MLHNSRIYIQKEGKMIYTTTLNPSIDYVMHLDRFEEGLTNRSKGESVSIGGKGINVSIVLKNLGVQSTALGFVAGFTGRHIVEKLSAYGIKNDFIILKDGISRINIKLKMQDESEINANGPNYSNEEVEALMRKLSKLQSGDYLVLAGSIPTSLPNHIYKDIMKLLYDKEVLISVDATGELLKNCLSYKPFLIKPNISELEDFFGCCIHSEKEIFFYAGKLVEMGAQNVIISMGKDGAIFVNKTLCLKLPAPKGILKNSVGAGDSMVAGFLFGCTNKLGFEKSFQFAVACGSATAFSEELAKMEEVQALLPELSY